MTFIGEWLKEIILVVLIAVFIELLLPNRAMERYVKFVVSLLILLTLLSPLMRLFSTDASEKIESAFMDNWGGLEERGAQTATDSILAQGELLRKRREAEALQWAGEEAARQMKRQIEQETGTSVERVVVNIREGKPSSEGKPVGEAEGPVIQTVQVVMRTGETPAVEAGQKKRIAVEPVEKVRVDDVEVSAKAGPEEESDGRASEVMADTEEVNPDVTKRIEALLLREWGVPRESVTVRKGEQVSS
ncbi:stage III sporulation protein AF [Paenibacillus sp. alder61]|uniref:Stage III sporulation protein AF n=1 Tax=Paenibacillus faecis TaxID=862114 RepID=A0A5D0CVJ4_9BACL|nr:MULTISPECIES: stage III sporulation protein AF [Paenibacillus]MCA1295889.1 stage III sporulation protein AF [Paenibacillus sp. alder61]TYA13204.1 stage III sporulation protein AF [Paenibacillus faecis]